MAILTRADAEARLRDVEGWVLERQSNDAAPGTGYAIRKQFVLRDFPEAVAFVDRLVPGAEEADHHPDVLINYKRVTLTYSTHSEGGLTLKDFAGAQMANDAYRAIKG